MNLEEKTNILKLCKEEPLSTCNVTIRQNQVKKLLKHGIIRPSISPYSRIVWIVLKKMDASGQKKWRMVIDFRKLNE